MTRARVDAHQRQFRQSELLRCCPGLSLTLFKDWVQRGNVLSLSTPKNPGSGRRPLYSALDVLQVATVWTMVQQGLPPSRAIWAWNWIVKPRALNLADSGLGSPDGSRAAWLGTESLMIAVMYTDPETGETMTKTLQEFLPAAADDGEDKDPDAFFILAVDRLIGRVVRELSKILSKDDPTSLGSILAAAIDEADQ